MIQKPKFMAPPTMFLFSEAKQDWPYHCNGCIIALGLFDMCLANKTHIGHNHEMFYE